MKDLILTMVRGSLLLCALPFTLTAQNNALLFDDVDDHITFASGPAFALDMTVEVWIYPTTVTGFQTITSWTSANAQARFTIANGFLEVFEDDDGMQIGSVTGTTAIAANEWTHVAMVRSGGSTTFYVNGVAESVGLNVASGGGNVFSIGAFSGTFNPYGGLMDEMRVWEVAQTQTAIRDQMFRTLIGNEDNLAAYYQFNETTGTTLPDLTANDFDGVLTNFPASTDPNWQLSGAIPQNALDFDGVNDYVDISAISPNVIGDQNNFTVELWVNLEPVFTGTRRGSIFSINDGGGANLNRMLLYIHDGSDPGKENRLGVVDAGINPDFDIVGPIIADDTWHHIAYSRSGTTGTLYVDGLQVGTHTADFTFVSGDLWSLGQEFDGSSTMSDFIDGQIDDVRIWGVGRTQAEIQAAMFSDLVGNEPNLNAYYTFNQGFASGANAGFTTLIDYSSNSFDGSLGAFALTGAASNWVSSGAQVPAAEIVVFEGNSNTDPEIFDGQAIPVNFGNSPVPVTKPLEFTIENNGFDDLVVTDITTTGTFGVTSSTSFTVTAGSTANFTVELLTLSDGIANGMVTIQNNDPNESNFTFSVTGTRGTLFPKAYWTDETSSANDEIDRIDLSGANNQNAYYSGFSVDIKGIAVDTKNNMVFWTNTDAQIRCGRIGDAGFTATNTLLSESGASAKEFNGIDIDGSAGKVYWCDAFNGQIRRVNFDGSNPEVLLTKGGLRDIALDIAGGKMYYLVNDGGSPEIWRANLDGTNPENLIISGTTVFRGLALDLVNNHMYWTANGVILRADLDGTNEVTVSTQLSEPESIDLDVYNEMIYVVDGAGNRVVRLNYQDDPLVVVQSSGIMDAQYLAIDTRTMDPLNLTSATLQSNAVNVPVDADVTIDFDQNLDVFTLNTSTVIVTGEQTGIINGALTGGGTSTITFDPTVNFKAGEVIRVTLTADLMNTGGNTLSNSYSYQFTTATNPGPLTPPSFAERVLTSTASVAFGVFPADVDGDGDMDAIGSAATDDEILWFENDGSQNFTERIVASSSNGPSGVNSSDLDSDGDMDILATSQATSSVLWFENDGNQNFTERVVSSTAGTPSQVYTVDMDGDGDQDVLSTSYGPTGPTNGRLTWHENDGSENFTDHVIPGINGTGAYPIDVDEDGDMDIVATSSVAAFTTVFINKLLWLENDGNQNFTEHLISDVSLRQEDTYATDMDGDGDVDILMVGSLNFLGWFENDGNENFTEHEIGSAESQPKEVYASDIDGDGDMDVLATHELQDEIALYLNNGSGSFTRQSVTTNADLASDVYAADMDSDGDMDVLSASRFDDKIAWYENTIVNNPPDISFVFYIDENSSNGTRVGAIFGTGNGEVAEPLTYSILSGNTNNAFALGSSTGIITVASQDQLDFETTPSFDLTVEGNDGNVGTMVSITINLNNIVDENPLGIDDLAEQVSIYPNPAHETLIIELTESTGNNLGVSLFTMSGSRVTLPSRVTSGSGSKIEIDLVNLDAGIYVLKLQSGESFVTKNILIR
ncbi:MAG: LamG-like jellyroll fold domain-containing protein [Cyclobacteriaceae bacterium]